ncbi:MAG: NAD-dependent epimerase/dehydratase family protein [Gemmatimonadaceae bacterium]
MAEKIIVTGAAGFIGSHVVDALLARGDIVVGIDNFDSFYDPDLKRANISGAMLHPSFELVEADVRDAAAMRRVIDAFHPDVIVHLAARAGVRPSIADPALYTAVNVLGTTVLLDAARAAKISRIIVASSSSVYGNDATPPFREDEPAITPISPYAATKRAAELMCETYAGLCDWMRIISLRFFTVYGPRQRPDLAIHSFTRKISAGESIPFFGDGTAERDYTYITDTVQGVLGAIERSRTAKPGHEIYNLGESAVTTLSSLVKLIEKALGMTAKLERLPAQPGDVRRTLADISRARTFLGYAPSVQVSDGIPRFVAWFRESGIGAASATTAARG